MLLWDANKLRYVFFQDNFYRQQPLPGFAHAFKGLGMGGLVMFVASVSIFVKLK